MMRESTGCRTVFKSERNDTERMYEPETGQHAHYAQRDNEKCIQTIFTRNDQYRQETTNFTATSENKLFSLSVVNHSPSLFWRLLSPRHLLPRPRPLCLLNGVIVIIAGGGGIFRHFGLSSDGTRGGSTSASTTLVPIPGIVKSVMAKPHTPEYTRLEAGINPRHLLRPGIEAAFQRAVHSLLGCASMFSRAVLSASA